mmetsp:Transcript_32002/g.80579  ORF Transcript_32002/g.80579 Transcript_32002/m.80579 type:complete len:222 (-) Transcript_32002:259-924(-)
MIARFRVGPSRMRSVVGSSASFSAPGRSMTMNLEKRCSSCALPAPTAIVVITWCSSMFRMAVERSRMGPNSVLAVVLAACPTRKNCISSLGVSIHLRDRLWIPSPSAIPTSSTSRSTFWGLSRSTTFSSTTSMNCMLSLCRHLDAFFLAFLDSSSFSSIASKIPCTTIGTTPSLAAGPDPWAVYVLPERMAPKVTTQQSTPSMKPGGPCSSLMIMGTSDRS